MDGITSDNTHTSYDTITTAFTSTGLQYKTPWTISPKRIHMEYNSLCINVGDKNSRG